MCTNLCLCFFIFKSYYCEITYAFRWTSSFWWVNVLSFFFFSSFRLVVFFLFIFSSWCLFSFHLSALLSFPSPRWTSLLWRVGALRTPVWNLRPVVGGPQAVNLSVTLSEGGIKGNLEKIKEHWLKFIQLLAILSQPVNVLPVWLQQRGKLRG